MEATVSAFHDQGLGKSLCVFIYLACLTQATRQDHDHKEREQKLNNVPVTHRKANYPWNSEDTLQNH